MVSSTAIVTQLTLRHSLIADKIGLGTLECSPMAREIRAQSQVESYQRLKKWYLMLSCLTLSIIRYVSKIRWSNPGKGVAPYPTPRCSSYRKGSLRVTLDYGRQLYLLVCHKNNLKNTVGTTILVQGLDMINWFIWTDFKPNESLSRVLPVTWLLR